MGIIYFLIGCSILIAVVFLGAFFWANKNGQHDDTHTPALRILFDDELESATKNNEAERVTNEQIKK